MADNSKVTFMSVEDFKGQVGATSMEVLKNPKTGKLFLSAGGNSYRVQQNISKSEEMRMLVPEEGISDACLVNVSGGAETQFSL
jgi:hypothetical protein